MEIFASDLGSLPAAEYVLHDWEKWHSINNRFQPEALTVNSGGEESVPDFN